MEKDKIIKSTEEQAVAAWTDFLKQEGFNEKIEALRNQDINLEEATENLLKIKEFISDPEHILGSPISKHGEIAEVMQVHISNARNAIEGLEQHYSFDGVGRFDPTDYMYDNQFIQSKFYNTLNRTILVGVKEHLKKYPEYRNDGYSYDIPKDQYEKLVDILDKLKNKPSELSTSDWTLAKNIQKFLDENGLEVGKDIKPSIVEYSEVGTDVAGNTLAKEEESIKERDKEIRDGIEEKAKPTLKEGLKVTAISATIEGALSTLTAIYKKCKEGKKLEEFTADDWKEIGIIGLTGTSKGAVRGSLVYLMTNYTDIKAPIATAYVSAMFAVGGQAYKYQKGEISVDDFIVNSQILCIDLAVSSISATIGSVVIPIPILGSIIGNVTGQYLWQFIKDNNLDEDKALKQRLDFIPKIDEIYEEQYKDIVQCLQDKFKEFSCLTEFAFCEDSNMSLQASALLAETEGVDEDNILRDVSDIDMFFKS